ncbi:MAG: PEP-CTERM sorting domain-containing protein [Phycisphaeraceae bacterium]
MKNHTIAQLLVALALLISLNSNTWAVPLLDPIGAPAGNRDNFTGTVAARFTVGASDVIIDALGYQDPGGGGLTVAHQIGVWRVSDSTLVAALTLPAGTSSTLVGQYRYEAIGFDLKLEAGQTYTIGAHVFSGSGDGWTDTGVVASFTLGAGLVDANPTNNFLSAAFGFPTSDGAGTDLRWAPANGEFLGFGRPVVDSLLHSDGTTNAARDDFTGTVGTAFTVTENKTINALGYQDAGLNGLAVDHLVGLWRISDGALIASTTVEAGTGGILDDQWRYKLLDSNVLLVAGESYIVGAQVFSGSGDPWTETATGVADFFRGPGLLDSNPTNRFLGGIFGFPGSDGGPADLRWAPANLAFITVPEPATMSLLLVMSGALLRRRRRAAA